MGLGILKDRLLKRKTPLNVMFSITNRCNSHCQYCDIPSRKQRELTTKEVLSILDELADAGTQRISFWGGEPLLREDLDKIITYSKKKGMYVNTDSNGYLVPQNIGLIKKLDLLILSLDGDEEAHDKNRQKGSYKKAMQAIKKTAGLVPVWTLTTLTKNNINSIKPILENARKYGFSTMFQPLYHPPDISRNTDSLLASNEEYSAAFRYLLEEKRKGAPIASSTAYLEYVSDWPDYSKSESECKFKNVCCFAGKLFCNIDTNGDVYTCSPMIGRVKAANILEMGFKKALNEAVKLNCESCIGAAASESNLVFSLKLKAILDWVKSTKNS